MHRDFAAALAGAHARDPRIQDDARRSGFTTRPSWPAIVLRTPKGWTGPELVDGKPVEGTFRAHQVPLSGLREDPKHLAHARAVDARATARSQLFDAEGELIAELRALAPTGDEAHGRDAVRERWTPAANR